MEKTEGRKSRDTVPLKEFMNWKKNFNKILNVVFNFFVLKDFKSFVPKAAIQQNYFIICITQYWKFNIVVG
jgi:hypothetical protein